MLKIVMTVYVLTTGVWGAAFPTQDRQATDQEKYRTFVERVQNGTVEPTLFHFSKAFMDRVEVPSYLYDFSPKEVVSAYLFALILSQNLHPLISALIEKRGKSERARQQDRFVYAFFLETLEKYKEALPIFESLATEGFIPAYYELGNMYTYKRGVEKNYEIAFNYFQKAAKLGSAMAQNKLGFVYSHGLGIAKDEVQAVRWYRLAANQGLAIAQFNLGVRYDFGHGVTKDEVQAVHWYRLAANQGLAIAQFNLGCKYERGQSVVKDNKQAVHWYRLAANQGNVNAQTKLRGMHERGVVCTKKYRTSTALVSASSKTR